MNTRQIALLRELMAAETPLTSQYLAQVNQVTTRTTRDDIKHLNDILSKNGAVIQSLRAKGYEFHIEDDQRFRHYLEEIFQGGVTQNQNMPDLPEERTKYLIKRLLLAQGYVKLDDLADELLISKSTIQNDIKTVKDILRTYDITLEKRPNYGLRMTGSELKMRFCMSEYIFDRSEKRDIDIFNSQLPWLVKENLNDIWDIIVDEIRQHDITLSDIAINNLFIHIAITYKRVQSGHHVSLYPKEFNEIIDQKEYHVAKTMVNKVETTLDVTFPEVEIAYIAIHLLGTKMISQTNLTEERIEQVMDDKVYQLTSIILETLETKLDLGIRHDRELIVGLSLHLKPAVNRYRYGMNIRNPLLHDIKANYPVAFEAAIIAGMVLEEETEVKIQESEIGYIALHIGAAMERKKLATGPRRCMVICASGAGSAQLIYYKLQSQFGSKLEVVGTTEYYKLNQISLDTLDFIVSTIPIPDELPVPVIQVNTILGEGDLEKVESFVKEDKDRNIFEYMKEELVFLNKDFHTKEEVLQFLHQELYLKHYVKDDFLDKTYEREKAAPTSFGNLVAIPHPITPQTDETFLSICTLQKPIMWDDKRVQFVCLLSVEKNSSADLQMLYKSLGKIVDDMSMVQQMLKCRTYEDLLKIFVST
ncbi:transcription antiterminator [Salibacterium salarium]|uniref:Transcription antiterminator n=1 Tax=Salibacterium salarium TaxID=284579 RepID=A0A3R9P494_9BACI|nr:BglG family transcription antiterminator [Salibacterium salarium]RSL30739.1 transcription antiterminator [Salibacterium salarium]